MTSTLTQFPASTAWLLHLSTDIVMFSIRHHRLVVLLRQRYSAATKDTDWALPGGYIRPTEPLDNCARRTLAQQTGITGAYLEQLYTFGRPDRHPRSRVITVAYLALIPGCRVLGSGVDNPNVRWFEVGELPRLYLDHDEIVSQAHARLRAKLNYSTIGFHLLAETFTLSEAQDVYQVVQGEELDKRNFRKRILAIDHIEDTGEQRRNGSHRPARLYRYTAPGAIVYTR